ncbi:MAG: peptide ABC transporter substrate-binding protein, partial [Chloroflexi bacterium]|nr:peptide ABC transporter substrate-binding protein [Chloroflexota bacterium]
MFKKRSLIIVALALVALFAVACQPEVVTETVEVPVEVTRVITETVVEEGDTVEVTRVVTEEVVVEVPAEMEEEPAMAEPVTNHGYSTTDIPTLDPQTGEDVVSINNIESLFVHLTNYDLDTAEVVPEAATAWDISEDGLQYTFTIRTDIPWVKHNPVTGETTQEVDDEGNPRFVTAHDFAYGIKRACDPNTGSYYSSVIAPQIVGCEDVLNAEDPEAIPEELVDAIGVEAVDDGTLVIELAFPAGFFLSMTPMWTLAATPQWAIEEHGDSWIEAGNIVTNGRYVLNEWVHNVRRTLLRNPLMPADMQGVGNIERMITNVVPDTSTGYALWLNGEVERSNIPDEELEAHLDQFSEKTVQVADLAVFYFGFRFTKPPFDDVHVRRAFSAAFDRATFVATVRQGQGLPMKHLAPPGIFGAPPISEVGVGFDVEYAQAQLAEAGYPNCEGFPTITLLGYSGQSTLNWIEFAQANWSENLGCDPSVLQIEQQSFAELLAATSPDTPDSEAVHIWTLGWGPDYADENNWVGDVLWCESSNRQKRECDAVDDMIV